MLRLPIVEVERLAGSGHGSFQPAEATFLTALDEGNIEAPPVIFPTRSAVLTRGFKHLKDS